MLEEYDEDTEVVIAEYQRYGCDFAYDVGEVSKGRYNNWDGDMRKMERVSKLFWDLRLEQ